MKKTTFKKTQFCSLGKISLQKKTPDIFLIFFTFILTAFFAFIICAKTFLSDKTLSPNPSPSIGSENAF
jgi:hypothetical protein